MRLGYGGAIRATGSRIDRRTEAYSHGGAPMSPDQTPRRRPRLSVRALMAIVLVVGGGSGWLAYRIRVQRDAVRAVERAGGAVRYRWAFGGSAGLASNHPFPK
jgi:hypothetical protein